MLLNILKMLKMFSLSITTENTLQLIKDLIGKTLDQTDFIDTMGFFANEEAMSCLHMG